MLERRTKLIQLFVSESEKEKLKEICESNKEPISVFVRKAMNYYLGEDIFREL